MGRRKTPEEAAWLAERYPTAPNAALLEAFRDRFGWAPTMSGLTSWASCRGLRKDGLGRIEWSAHPEYGEFLAEAVPGRTEDEIADAFEAEFGVRLTRSQVKNAKTRLGVTSGTHGGRFEKGHVPHNKGRTWDELGYGADQRDRMARGQFAPGRVPWTGDLYPVGSERVTRDGYVQVKVRERSPRPGSNRCWELKQRVVWERANGRALGPDEVVLFADGDRGNFDPGNLVAVTRRVNAVINRMRLDHCDRATLETAVAIAELTLKVGERQRGRRKCRECRAEFAPRFARQARCDACIRSMRAGKDGRDEG